MKFVVIAAAIFTSSVTFGAEPAACVDLAKAVCTRGARTDVTGTTSGVDGLKFSLSELDRLQGLIREKFKIYISSNEGAKLKEELLSAANPKDASCIADYPSEACNNFVSKKLAELYSQVERSDYPTVPSTLDSVRALTIIRSSEYLSVADSFTKQNKAPVSSEQITKFKNEIFPNAKKYLIEAIGDMSIDDKTKSKMIQTVRETELAGLECDSVFHQNTGLLQSLFPNAEYSKIDLKIHVCPAYLRYSSSEFDLISLVAHELGHSIDPCTLPDDQERVALSELLPDHVVEDQYLKKNFISCLRSPNSIAAKSFRPVLTSDMAGGDDDGEGHERGIYPNSPARACYDDQITESMADWFSAETLARFIKHKTVNGKFLTQDQILIGMQNVFRPICSDDSSDAKSEAQQDVHPSATARLNAIFATQPKLREMMGCKTSPKKHYCDLNNPSSLVGGAALTGQPIHSSKNKAKQ